MMTRLSRVLACSIALLAVAGCPPEVGQPLHAPRITQFSVAPADTAVGQAVSFTWQVEDPDGDPVSGVISLDQEGRSDYSIPNALATTTQQHVFRNAGEFQLRLRVSDGSFESTAHASVTVRGPITLNIENPAAGQEVGSSMDVSGTFQSVNDPVSAEVQVEDRVAALELSYDEASNLFRFGGKLDVAGLAYATRILTVRVRDEAGNLAEQARSFWYRGDPPSFEIYEPITGDVASPLIRIRGRCTTTDPGGCTLTLADDRILTGVNGEFDEEYDLSAQHGKQAHLTMRATDPGGRMVEFRRDVWVESSAALVPVLELDADVISDVNATAAVGARKHGVWRDTLVYLDRATSALSERKFDSRDVGQVKLTPTGYVVEILSHCFLDTSCAAVYESWDGDFSPLFGAGYFAFSSSLLGVQGNFVLWNDVSSLSLYDGLDRSTIQIRPTPDSTVRDGSVAPDGTVVYTTPDKVYLYKDGVSHEIYATTIRYQQFSPKSDGAAAYYVRMNGDRTEIVVFSDAGDTSFDGAAPYHVRDGWIAFSRMSAFGVQEAWLRDAAGVERELAPDLRANKTVQLLTPDGRVIFRTQDKHYLAQADGTAVEIGTNLGKPYLIDGTLHVAIGRVLFRIEP